LLLPLSFLLFRNKSKDKVFPLLAFYGIFCFSFLFFYFDIPKENRKYLSTIYTFLEYSVFAFIFWSNVKSKKIRLFILIASLLFLAFQFYYAISGKVRKIDSVPIGIETILMLLYIVYFFYEFSRNISNLFIYNHYLFWIAVGILIYLGGSFFFFMLINNLSKEQLDAFGDLTFIAEILKNILFSVAIFVFTKNPTNNNKEKSTSIPFLDMI
jgi:hypothetical protein